MFESVVLAALALSAASAVDAAPKQRILVLPRPTASGISPQRVWYAPAGTNASWTEMPADAITARRYDLGPGATCLYDVKLQYADGYMQVFDNVNVCAS